MPAPKPTAVNEAKTLSAPFILSPNSSRMIPNDRGSTPPPAPCTTRARIIQATLGARAAISEPMESSTRQSTSIRVLPTTSPTRPSSGVQIEADSRYAVSTQVTVCWSVWSSAWMVVRTGTVSDCSSTKAQTDSASTANVSVVLPAARRS